MHKLDLALNNLQVLICPKTQPTFLPRAWPLEDGLWLVQKSDTLKNLLTVINI